MPIKRTGSLFSRTGFTIALSLLFFFIVAFGSIFYYALAPMARQSSDDLAGLIVFSAQTWTELPPETRDDFIKELRTHHGLTLLSKTSPLELDDHPLETPYIYFFKHALSRRTGSTIPIKTQGNDESWLWIDIPTTERTLRFGFPHSRIGVQPSLVILWVILGGFIVTILTTLLLVRRLTLPLQHLYAGTRAFAKDQQLGPISVSGPHELVTLTESFNKMMRQIHQLMENRTTLLAGISHDLRTPITRMKLTLEMLNDKTDPQLIEGMQNDLNEMAELIDRTMEVAKGLNDSDKETQETDIAELIGQLVMHYQSNDQIRINWKAEHTCIHVVNAFALRRVLTNLLENALRYASDDVINVYCDCNAKSCVIQICDKGPGIPADMLETVFQPFHRLETSRNKSTGGSGLGLAIVKQLCDANGWLVKLQPRQGGGTIARLEMPLGD